MPLHEKSLLRSELVPKTKPSSAGQRGKQPGKKTGSGVQNQSLTFKTKIRSSGYTKEQPRCVCLTVCSMSKQLEILTSRGQIAQAGLQKSILACWSSNGEGKIENKEEEKLKRRSLPTSQVIS